MLIFFAEGTENFDVDEVADEMFSDGMGLSEMDDSGNASVVLMDLSSNEKNVHADFFNDFEDLFDDDNDDWALSADVEDEIPDFPYLQPFVS